MSGGFVTGGAPFWGYDNLPFKSCSGRRNWGILGVLEGMGGIQVGFRCKASVKESRSRFLSVSLTGLPSHQSLRLFFLMVGWC